MASLIITTKVSTFKGNAPIAWHGFKDEDKMDIVAMPEMKDKTVSWTVPDTSWNRALFRRDFEPCGKYGCKSVDLEKPEEFEVIAEASKKGKAEDKTEEDADADKSKEA